MASLPRDGTSLFVLRCEFHCSSTGAREDKLLEFQEIPKSVNDVKVYIQAHFSIPKCVQKLSMNGHPLADYHSISDLYIRSGDRLSLIYLCEADVKFILDFILSSLRPLASQLEASLRDNQMEEKVAIVLSHSCEIGFGHITSDIFLPWSAPRSEANRQLFVQEGGLHYTIEILSHLLTGPVEEINTHLKNIQALVLSLLWNFAANRSARLAVIQMGGFTLMLRSIARCSSDKVEGSEVFDQAVGCIANYSEVECCQMPLAQNLEVMQQLLMYATQRGLLGDASVFTQSMISECLFNLSHCFEVHKYLAEPKTLGLILQFYWRYDLFSRNNLVLTARVVLFLLRYELCLTLARLLLFSYDIVPIACQPQIIDITFASQTTPAAVTAITEHCEANWITAAPFVEMLYTPLLDETKSDETPMSLKAQCQLWSVQIALLALQGEMGRSIIRKLVVEQALLDFIVCLPWGMPLKWQDSCMAVMKLFRKDCQLPVPRLSSIARAALTRSGEFTGLRDL